MKFIIVLFVSLLSGCELIDDVMGSPEDTIRSTLKSEMSNPYQYSEQVELLVDELSKLDKYDLTSKKTIVSTFVWNESFTSERDNNSLKLLGIHLAEQTKHQLVHNDANVIEGYSGKSLAISDDGTYFLSRDIDELASHVKADYVVTGIMSKQKQGIMVNAYVVEFTTQLIVGSAQQLFPYYIFSGENHATLKNGKIFVSREGY